MEAHRVRPDCCNELRTEPIARRTSTVGPRDMHALAWSRISIDIARVRSGSLNPTVRVHGAPVHREEREKNEKWLRHGR